MNFNEIFRSSLRSIRENKLRSFLTLLGVVIGIFSIIGVMTAINVLQASVESNMNGLGAGTFQVQKYPNINMGNNTRWKYRNRKNLDYRDFERLKNKLKLVDYASAEDWYGGKVIRFKNNETKPNISLVGITTNWEFTNKLPIENGRSLTETDLESSSHVCIVGHDVTDVLMPQYDPVGQMIKIDGIKYRIIGVQERLGQSFGNSRDNRVYVPLTTYFKYYGNASYTSLHYCFSVADPEKFEEGMQEVINELRIIRGVKPGEPDDFELWTNASLIDNFNKMTSAIKIAALLIASIALLASGIGIMNIMLVTVAERTREIGIRKSIGAKSRDILYQFMIEALILTEIGGVFGIILGILAGNIVALLMKTAVIFPWNWAGIGILVCSLIAIIFGSYPAYKAAKLDPIEALRYE